MAGHGGGRDAMNKNLKYVKQNNIAVLLNDMVVHLLAGKPTEPLDALIGFLQVKARDPEVRSAASAAAAAAPAAPAPAAEARPADERAPAATATAQAQAAADIQMSADARPMSPTRPAIAMAAPLPPPGKKEEVLEVVKATGEPQWERTAVGHTALSAAERGYPRRAEVDVTEGDDGVLGKRGLVVLHHDESAEQPVRVTIRFPDDAEDLDVPVAAVRRVTPADHDFPLGTRVEFVAPSNHDGAEGLVINHRRGRVGVKLEDGTTVGALPPFLRKARPTPQQQLPVGTRVELLDAGDATGLTGTVASHRRGRCGVRMAHNEQEVHGRPATSLRKLPPSAEQAFPLYSTVEVVDAGNPRLDGKVGRVQGHGRGRVGVKFDDGSEVGLVPQALRKVPPTPAQRFPVGTFAQVTAAACEEQGMVGSVKSVYRGRVALELLDGTLKGFVAEHLTSLQDVPCRVGEFVELLETAGRDLAGRTGRITSLARHRAGVEFNDGTLGGFPLMQLRKIDPPVYLQFPKGTDVVVAGRGLPREGETGKVVGHHRGRIGVEFADADAPVGYPPGCLKRAEIITCVHKIPISSLVTIMKGKPEHVGRLGTAVSYKRGRVAVKLDDGEVIGVPPTNLCVSNVSTGLYLKFPINSFVTVKSPDVEVDGRQGQVVGHGRGRLGVVLEDGTKRGFVGEHLVPADMPARRKFPVGTAVVLTCEDPRLTGRSATVAGHARGRVGVTLEDGSKVGVPACHLEKVVKTGPQEFPVGTYVSIISDNAWARQNGRWGRVVGHGRGRVGVELEDGTTLGVPPSCLAKEQKTARQSFPVGTRVTVKSDNPKTNGRVGEVKGYSRGRVGVELEDGTLVGVPGGQVEKVAKTAEQRYPLGMAVEVLTLDANSGRCGRVVGVSRGRVGVELENGDIIGALPDHIDPVKKTAEQSFPVGSSVEVVSDNAHTDGRQGRVTGYRRGRVGVELEDGERVGVPQEHLRRVPPSAQQAFPISTAVEVASENLAINGRRGKVTGYHRGRVGVELEDGTVVGVPAASLMQISLAAEQAFPVGTRVDVITQDKKLNGRTGTVVGYARGRVGVELEDGSKIGVPAEHLRKATMSVQQRFPVGSRVDVVNENQELTGRSGRVVGYARGRVGVKLEDNMKIGVPAEHLRMQRKTAAQAFPVGTLVDVICEDQTLSGRSGKVTGNARGRVGVELEDGTKVGIPAEHLQKQTAAAQAALPLGTAVNIVSAVQRLSGRSGRVVGHARGRVGVELEDGSRVGVPSDSLRKATTPPARAFPVGSLVELRCEKPELAGRSGRVVGQSRGRVGVELEDGSTVGVPAEDICKLAVSHVTFPPGTVVDIICEDQALSGRGGTVVGNARGRVGVELEDGSKVGVPAAHLRRRAAAVQQRFRVGTAVEVVGAGRCGRVTGYARGRVGVELEDGTRIGLPVEQLRVATAVSAAQTFPAGTEVEVCGDNPAAGRIGRVKQQARGRVGVVLEDGSVIGVPTGQVRKVGRNETQAFPNGTAVVVVSGESERVGEEGRVVGSSRGRVGVELANGAVVGVPAAHLRAAGKSAAQACRAGDEVEIHSEIAAVDGRTGRVVGVARGRVGVVLADGTTVGVPAGDCKAVGRSAAQEFPEGTAVVIITEENKHAGEEGRVVGSSRGRVGVELANGAVVGVPAAHLRAAGKSAAQGFPEGVEVEIHSGNAAVDGRTGRVVGVARGRVGVVLADGTTVGVPAEECRAVGKSAAQAFPEGVEVEVVCGESSHAGATGTVTGVARGRVGVDLGDGEVRGFPPSQLRVVRPRATFPAVGTLVYTAVGLLGKVTGTARGRVGVELDDGTAVGVPPETLTVAPTPVADAFPEGTEVEILHAASEHCGAVGTVVGHARGRVGVSIILDEGPDARIRVKTSFVPAHIRRVDHSSDAAAAFAVDAGVKINAAGDEGVVTGHARGRVAVKLSTGEVKSFPKGLLDQFNA